MKSILVYSFCFIFLFSCKEEEQVPGYVIPQDKMIEVLVDIELKQAEVKYKMAHIDTRLVDHSQEFTQTLSKHNMDMELFNNNMEYYSSKPLIMQDIYIRVIELLSEKQTSITK